MGKVVAVKEPRTNLEQNRRKNTPRKRLAGRIGSSISNDRYWDTEVKRTELVKRKQTSGCIRKKVKRIRGVLRGGTGLLP